MANQNPSFDVSFGAWTWTDKMYINKDRIKSLFLQKKGKKKRKNKYYKSKIFELTDNTHLILKKGTYLIKNNNNPIMGDDIKITINSDPVTVIQAGKDIRVCITNKGEWFKI